MQIIFSVLRMVVARSYACENIRNMLRFNLANGIGALVHSEKYRHYFFAQLKITKVHVFDSEEY